MLRNERILSFARVFEWTRDIGRGKNFGEIFFFVLFKNSEHVVAEKHEERCWLMAHSGGRSRIKLAKKETTSRGAWNNGAEVGRESKILKYLRCRVRTLERDTRLSMLPAESEDGERVRGIVEIADDRLKKRGVSGPWKEMLKMEWKRLNFEERERLIVGRRLVANFLPSRIWGIFTKGDTVGRNR